MIYRLKLLCKDLIYEKNIFGCTVILIFLVNICFINAFSLIKNYDSTVSNVENQLGADIIIVSDEYDDTMKDSLFLGKPSTIEFNSTNVINSLNEIKEIKDVSSRLFFSSLDSSCCEEELQFIMYDSENDMFIKSWIKDYKRQTERRDIIIGSDINFEIGDKVTFFDVVFCVAGKLSKTGTGYDSSVFLDENSFGSLSKYWGEGTLKNKSSMILVNVDDSEDINKVLSTINSKVKKYNLVAYRTSNLYENISKNISNIKRIAYIFALFMFVISGISIYAINVLKIQNKKKEVTLLNIMGTNKNGITKIVLYEQSIMCLLGTFLAIICSLIIVIIFKNNIQEIFNFNLNNELDILKYGLIGFIITLLINVLSVSGSIDYLSKKGNI